MIVKLFVSVLLFVSLFFIFAPPTFLGSNGPKKAIAIALAACAALIAVRESPESKQGMTTAPAVASPSQAAAAKPAQAERQAPSPSSTPSPTPLTPPKPLRTTDLKEGLIGGQHVDVVRVSAMNLFREYDRNEIATDLRLQGKIVEINGKVTGIKKDFLDEAYVELQTPNEFMSATVRPVTSDLDKVSRLHKGQFVTFRCERMERFMGGPSGKKCVVID